MLMFLGSCAASKKKELVNNEMILRIHTSRMEKDWYELKGDVTQANFTKEFQKINCFKDYWTETNKETFNFHSIEVFNKENMTYFGISVCPNTTETFQYFLCFGKHSEPNDSIVTRMVKLYGTGSDNPKKVIAFINLYFLRDLTQLENELNKIDFFEEIEDVYSKIECK